MSSQSSVLETVTVESVLKIRSKDIDSLSFLEVDVERQEQLRLMEELQHSNKLVMQLRERLFKKIELMNNETAIFEISKLKYKGNRELPIPLYSKARKIVLHSFKTLVIYREKPNIFEKIKKLFKTSIIICKKMFVALFWIYMAQKFQTIEMPSVMVEELRTSLNKNYMEFYMIISKRGVKLRDYIINILPFLMGEAIKSGLEIRLKNGKNLLNIGEQNQLYSIMHKELLGISCSLEYIQQNKIKVLHDSIIKPQITQNSQQSMSLQSTLLRRKTLTKALTSTKIASDDRERERNMTILSRDLIQIFDRDGQDVPQQQKRNTNTSTVVNRNLANKPSLFNVNKPPIQRKVQQQHIIDQKIDMSIDFQTLQFRLSKQSQSEAKLSREKFNIYQCSPMFQNSRSLLGADSPVNKSFGIQHITADHTTKLKENSQILYKKYQIEKKRSENPLGHIRKKAMRGMSILKKIHFDKGQKVSTEDKRSVLNNTISIKKGTNLLELTTTNNNTLIDKSFFDRRLSMGYQSNKSSIVLEKDFQRFFIPDNEVNLDGTYKKTSKVRQVFKQSQKLIQTLKPPLPNNMINQQLDTNSVQMKQSMLQNTHDFYNPQTTNKQLIESFLKSNKNIGGEEGNNKLQSYLSYGFKDMANQKIKEQGYQVNGQLLLKNLDQINLGTDENDLVSNRELDKYKGKTLFLNEKRKAKDWSTSKTKIKSNTQSL